VKRSKEAVVAILLLAMVLLTSGCDYNYKQLLAKTASSDESLIKVQIVFVNDIQTVCYVRSLGLEEKGQIYLGGSSLNYMYDRNGNILGSFNYMQVVYMKILPDEGTTD